MIAARDSWKTSDSLELMDKSLVSSCPKSEILRFVHVGLLCVQTQAIDRPAISDVISMLSNEAMYLPDPNQPAYIGRKSGIEAYYSNGTLDFASINTVTVTVKEAR